MNKIIVWNCRGAGHRDFRIHARALIEGIYHEMIVLLETRVKATRGMEIMKKLDFDNHKIIPGEGFSGGI